MGDLVVDETRPADTVIIDPSGNVIHKGADGSMTVNPTGQDSEERGPSNFNDNLADELDVPLATISNMLLEGIQADISSRSEWESMANKGAELLGVKLEEASSQVSPEGSISKTRHTLLLEAVTRSWANSRAELLPASGPVKVRDDQVQIGTPSQPPPPGAPKPPKRSELAEALEMDMNHYLTVVDKEYYPDFSRMLFNRALIGMAFRKVYRCPLRRRPVSIWVRGEDLIVSNDASHLEGAGRVTERNKMRQSVVKRLQASGHWREVSLVTPSQTATPTETTIGNIQGTDPTPTLPADHRHEIYECYCELDDGPLARDENGKTPGYPLPYRVTIDKDSRQILEIRRNWKEGDEDFKARRRYVKYGFVPGLGFYDFGYTHLLGNPERALTAIERMLIDAGMYCSFPGGVMAKGPGTRQRTNEIRPDPGQFAVIDTGGQAIQDVVMPMPYKEPSAVLQAIMQSIAQDGRRLAGTLELPVGEGRVGDVPVGTIMSYVDAISKVPSAVHKDDHTAQQEEYELLKELFMEEPEALTKFAKSPARAQYTMEELNDQELVPAADPNIPSQTHRVMQTTALVQLAAMPQFANIADNREIFDRAVKVLGVEDSASVTMPAQPPQAQPPPPQVIAAQIRSQADMAKTQATLQKAHIDADAQQTEIALEAQDRAADRASEEKRAGLSFAADVVKAHADSAQGALEVAAEQTQHEQTLAQADAHKAADLATAQQNANNPAPDGGGS